MMNGEQLQQEPQQQQQGYPYYSQDEQKGDEILKYQLEWEQHLEIMEHQLRGEHLDLNTQLWMIPKEEHNSEAWVTETGIKNIISFWRPFFTQHTPLTNLKEKEINEICMSVGNAWIGLIKFNAKRWGLAKTKMTALKELFFEPFYMLLKRSSGGEERNLAYGRQKIMELIHRDDSVTKKPTFNIFPSQRRQ